MSSDRDRCGGVAHAARSAAIDPRQAHVDVGGHLHLESLVRALSVVVRDKRVEARLLLQHVGGGGMGCVPPAPDSRASPSSPAARVSGCRPFLSTVSRLLPRISWSAFVVTPATLLRWRWAPDAGPIRDRRVDRSIATSVKAGLFTSAVTTRRWT